MYEAVLAWAYGAKRTIEAGGTPYDGLAVANTIINSSFPGLNRMVRYKSIYILHRR